MANVNISDEGIWYISTPAHFRPFSVCCLLKLYSDMALICCGLEFHNWQHVQSHLSTHSAHKNCGRCRKGFWSPMPFEQHMRDSSLHKQEERPSHWQSTNDTYDAVAEEEGTAYVTRHRAADLATNTVRYNGVPPSTVKPVFRTSYRLRFSKPTVQDIIRSTGTALDPDIVGAILEGALRLLPSDESPEGKIARKTKMATKAAQALAAETAFAAKIQGYQPRSSKEAEQRERIRHAIDAGSVHVVKLTPDILFFEATQLCGFDCNWLEYKNMFGFKSNPFVHKKNKAQLQRYVAAFGKGMVVYRLGYESEHLVIDGLKVMREADLVRWINSQEAL